MKKEIIIIIVGTILVIIVGICTYFAMDDLGLFNGSYQHSTLAQASAYMGACFTAVKLWTLWDKFMGLVRVALTLLFIVFIIAGIGVVLGF